jgi:divalent metal cation (Fe/Co/Zn/Cd) transporter
VNGIRSLIANHQEVGRVNEVLTMHIGPEYILANLCIELRPGLSVMEEQRVVSRLQRAIKRQFPAVRRIFFEISQSQ